MRFSIGNLHSGRIEIQILRYERDASGCIYDDNWLSVIVDLSFGGFKGCFDAAFLTMDLKSFLTEAEKLYSSLKGTAKFDSMEGQLVFTLEGNGRGGISLNGIALDQVGTGHELKFFAELDQTELEVSLIELRKVVNEFPVRVL
jgi:hypothetical protein